MKTLCTLLFLFGIHSVGAVAIQTSSMFRSPNRSPVCRCIYWHNNGVCMQLSLINKQISFRRECRSSFSYWTSARLYPKTDRWLFRPNERSQFSIEHRTVNWLPFSMLSCQIHCAKQINPKLLASSHNTCKTNFGFLVVFLY